MLAMISGTSRKTGSLLASFPDCSAACSLWPRPGMMPANQPPAPSRARTPTPSRMNFSLPFFGFSVVASAAALILCSLAWPGACARKVNGTLMNREDEDDAGGNQHEAGDIGGAEGLAQVE